MANILSTNLRRTTDFVARYGGEEFISIVLGDDAHNTFEYIKQIRQKIEELHIPHMPSVSQWVTVSAGGVTVIPKSDDQYSTYLNIADTMLYDAKRFGRNRVIWFGDDTKMWQ